MSVQAIALNAPLGINEAQIVFFGRQVGSLEMAVGAGPLSGE